jgi:hypothetical protein
VKNLLYLAGLGLVPALLAAQAKTVTWTGWFSESNCAPARVNSGKLGPTNPECSKTCIEKGATPLFISEQAKALFKVRDYADVIGDLGYHVSVTATLDEAAGSISIQKVERLSFDGAACARPNKPTAR